MKQDQIIAALFVVCCVAAVGWFTGFANWAAYYSVDGEHSYAIELPVGPAWHSPKLPPYSEFRRFYHDLPTVPLQRPEIKVGIDWSIMLERILAVFWGITFLFELMCLTAPELRSNIVLLFVSTFAYSLTIAFALSIVSFFIFGGWGLPNPVPFWFCGIVGGTIWGGIFP